MKILIPSMFILLFWVSCTSEKPMYYWEKYETTSYNYLKNNDEKSIQELIETYQKIINKQKSYRNVAPPGIYADYGFLLLQMDKIDEGKAMLLKEIETYPESILSICSKRNP